MAIKAEMVILLPAKNTLPSNEPPGISINKFLGPTLPHCNGGTFLSYTSLIPLSNGNTPFLRSIQTEMRAKWEMVPQ
jgi:hypothetical protein